MDNTSTYALRDETLAATALFIARQAHPRRQNWELPEPCIEPVATGAVRENNKGRYSRSCTYTRWTYTPRYHSALRVCDRRVEVWQEGCLVRSVAIPAGMSVRDDHGLSLVAKDGTDYHPTAAEWVKERRFAGMVRERMTAARRHRREATRLAIVEKRTARIKQREIATCRVTLHDSRAAGNCVTGTLEYARRVLHMDPQTIIDGQHLVTVPASRLLQSSDPRAHRAVEMAWQRETLIQI